MNFLKKRPDLKEYKPLLGSFLLALLLWSAVTTDKVYSIRLSLPLKIVQLAPGYVLKANPPKTVNLKVRGKGRALISLYFYKPIIKLELPQVDRSMKIDLKEYQNQFYVGQDLGIEIEDILDPRSIELQVDRYKETKKPVEIRHRIKILPGFVLSAVVPEVDSVKVMGPASLVDAIKTVKCELIRREKVRYPFKAELKLISPDPGIIKIDPQSINVRFVIEQIVERNIYNIPIQIIGLPGDLIADAVPPVISIRIKGSERKIEAVTPEQITAIFDYQNDYHVGRSHYIPQIEVPEGVQVIQISPRSFRLQLRKKEGNQ
ncbi:MAG: YbbR-like domain-containing protein [Calditrichaeota bacterium]|nr:YbbR-like domain-containing protein [Calditrichota bacterium]